MNPCKYPYWRSSCVQISLHISSFALALIVLCLTNGCTPISAARKIPHEKWGSDGQNELGENQLISGERERSASNEQDDGNRKLTQGKNNPEQNDLDDPSKDGWDSEVFHSHVKKQLEVLAELISTKDLPENKKALLVEKLFVPALQTNDVWPNQLTKQFQGDGVTVYGTDSKPNNEVRASKPEVLLSRLTQKFDFDQPLRVEFKIFRVNVQNKKAVTRQFVSIFGKKGPSALELLAEWDITWLATDKKYPLISEIVCNSISESSFADRKPIFVDVTRQALGLNPAFNEQHAWGLNHWMNLIEADVHRELMGHQGLAVADIDGDQLEDVYLCQPGGLPNKLYRNNGDGTATDISKTSGVDMLDQSTGILMVDLDNDADQDLVLGLDSGVAIFSNNGEPSEGQTRFRRQLFLQEAPHIYSPTAVDFDLDGDLDLYLCLYYAQGSSSNEFPYPYPFHDANNGGRNILLRNDGDFKFTDVTADVGLDENNSKFSYAAAWEDFDRDGDLDLYVANDFGRNNLYVNTGGRFLDQTDKFNAEDGNFGMSISWGDYNLDGWSDLYISNMFSSAGNRIVTQNSFNPGIDTPTKNRFLKLARGNSLLQNQNGQSFTDVSVESGTTMGRWAWCSTFTDINNDGWEDLLVGNGYITGEDTSDL